MTSVNVTEAATQQREPNDYSSAVYVLLVLPNVFIFIVIFFGFTSSRTEKRKKEIKDVRTRIGKADGEVPMSVGLGRFGNSRYLEELKKETKRCADIQRGFQPAKDKCTTPGWGRMDSAQANVHYATEMANSYHSHILGRTSQERWVGLDAMNPREYLLEQCRRNPKVSERTCLKYLRMYEAARFGAADIDEAMYRDFLSVVEELSSALHPPP